MKKLRILMIMVAAVMTFSLASTAVAATVATTFDVVATVNSTCSITNAPNLAFGLYDPTSGAVLNGTTTITIRCTKNTDYELYITPASGARIMVGAPTADNLPYELYSDPGRTAVFQSAAGGPKVTSLSGTTDIDTIVYGQIPASQDVAIGTYTQTVTVTVDYI